MNVLKKGLLAMFILLAGYACKDTSVFPPEKASFLLSDIRTADFWQIYKPELIEIRVQHPDGPGAVKFVQAQLLKDTLIASIPLYDDGGATTQSGDLVAGDGVFRNRIQASDLVNGGGDYILRFQATDRNGNPAPVLEKSIKIGSNLLPQIHAVYASGFFPSGFFSDTLAVIVFDPDSTSEVDDIILKILRPGGQPVLYNAKPWVKSAGDSLFTLGLDSSFAAGLSGDYRLSFQAHDKYGGLSDTVQRPVQIENKAGYISQISMPSEVTKPAGGTKQIFITAAVGDPQSLADVDSVYFYSKKPDGSLSNGGKPFVMVDNGKPFNINNPFDEAGDKIAGDGVFSLTSIIDANAATGIFVFSFYTRDKVGNLSMVMQDSINVKP